MRIAVSKLMISDSVELCETAPCFLHIHPMGTKVVGPIRHRKAPDVDLLSFRSPANDASQNKTNTMSLAGSPRKET